MTRWLVALLLLSSSPSPGPRLGPGAHVAEAPRNAAPSAVGGGRALSAGHDAPAQCDASDTVLCLNGGRFRLSVSWRANEQEGVGHARTLTGDTGYFWFFDEANVEIVAKVLDGRPLNGAFWVFYGGLSNVEYTLEVTDTHGGETRSYSNPAGHFASVGDTRAFPADATEGTLQSPGTELTAMPAAHGEIAPGEQGNEAAALSHVHCEDGLADVYPCWRTDLLSVLPLSQMGTETGDTGNDVWGWTDPLTGVEYALMGISSGTSIVDLRDPEHPLYLGKLPTQTASSAWRDIKVYRDHALVVADASPGHGLQILDLTQLRQLTNTPQTFSPTAHYGGFGSAHNLAINEATGFAYVVGSDTCLGGLHMIDVREPRNPRFAGCFSDDGYTHDAHCVLYHGADERYEGREICFASNEDTLTIVDVTAKESPIEISRASYQGVAYTHQAWLTEDHDYLLVDDELDELQLGQGTRTYIWQVADLEAPKVIGTHTASTTAIDHNQYTHQGFTFQANYRSGLRILDLQRVHLGELEEVAFFDTFPENDDPVFSGAWSVYPFFHSGAVVVSGTGQGLFILEPMVAGLRLPRTPSHLRAQLDGLDVELAWRDQADNELGYRILRGTNGRPPELLAELRANRTRFVDSALAPDSRYRYQVLAYNETGESDRLQVAVETPTVPSECIPGATVLCLGDGRFYAAVEWRDSSQQQGVGQARRLTDDAGYFWYFNDTNVELVLKILDGRSFNNHHWVFYGSLSNVEFTLTVVDTATGKVRTYSNPAGEFASVGDTVAF